jgi:hypothetical protein
MDSLSWLDDEQYDVRVKWIHDRSKRLGVKVLILPSDKEMAEKTVEDLVTYLESIILEAQGELDRVLGTRQRKTLHDVIRETPWQPSSSHDPPRDGSVLPRSITRYFLPGTTTLIKEGNVITIEEREKWPGDFKDVTDTPYGWWILTNPPESWADGIYRVSLADAWSDGTSSTVRVEYISVLHDDGGEVRGAGGEQEAEPPVPPGGELRQGLGPGHIGPAYEKLLPDFYKYMEPTTVPLLQRGEIKSPPSFARKEIRRLVQPYYDLWMQAAGIVESLSPDAEEDEWWEPTQNFLDLEKLQDSLRELAFETVPNPDYDAEAAEKWRKANPYFDQLNQKKITWGQSTNPSTTQEGPSRQSQGEESD